VFLLLITTLSMVRGEASGPSGPATLELSTCGVKNMDVVDERETWHSIVL